MSGRRGGGARRPAARAAARSLVTAPGRGLRGAGTGDLARARDRAPRDRRDADHHRPRPARPDGGAPPAARPSSPEPAPPIDAALLSHLHHDHADLPTLRRIGEAQVLAEVANARWLRRRGLVARSLDPTAWRQVTDDVQVRLVPAVHAARPMPHRPNGAVGLLVRGAGVIVWFAGDTALYPGMADPSEIAGAPIDCPSAVGGHVPIHYCTLHPRGWPAGQLDWMTAPGERLPAVLADRSNASGPGAPGGGTLTLR